ncbi:MAG: urate hydroxylase PuuD [Gemmatimonadota bacterium]
MTELLDLLARWVHVIAGIMWVGNSMLFNFLDRNLRKRSEPDSYGDIWLLHSGGFYLMEKNKGERIPAGLRLPAPLHWFKWQAYTTWITGALLLVVVYYVGSRALLEDSTVRAISHGNAVALAVGIIAGAWLVYEGLFRLIGERWPRATLVLSIIVLIDAIVLYTTFFSSRAAFVHIGAMLGTIMAGNVAFTIMPSQRELVAALREGREPSQVIADRAKTRSIHNNYITFPVIALMISSHFPSLYSDRSSASLVLILIAGSALVRHFMNTRFTNPRWGFGLTVSAGATIGVLALAMVGGPTPPPHAFGGRFAEADSASMRIPDIVTFADARRIIDRRCAACHSITPSDVSLGRTPVGIAFDTPEQIVALVSRIRERAVIQRTMPPGNKTFITDTERAILAKWIESGAVLK